MKFLKNIILVSLLLLSYTRFSNSKTKKFLEKINTLGVENNVLILIDEFNENLYLSSRNIPHVLVVEAKHADPVSLVHFQKVIATSAAIKQLEGMFA